MIQKNPAVAGYSSAGFSYMLQKKREGYEFSKFVSVTSELTILYVRLWLNSRRNPKNSRQILLLNYSMSGIILGNTVNYIGRNFE